MTDFEPLGLILVSKGSKGDKLLFTYPYSSSSERNDRDTLFEATPYRISSYASEVPVRQIANSENADFESLLVEEYCGLPSYILAYLFAVKPDVCGGRFELKINDVRFVGFPLIVSERSDILSKHGSEEIPNVLLFNLLFVLRARSSKSVVNSYQDLSQLLSVAIDHEESRCGYLSYECNEMLQCQDDVQSLPEGERVGQSPYKMMLNRSHLAKDLKQVFDEVKQYGMTLVHINHWIEVSFCLPQKVLATKGIRPASPKAIDMALQYLRPFHGILLLDEVSDVRSRLPIDASPSLIQLLNVYTPLKSLQVLSLDADLPMSQVFLLVRELVLWGQAIIVFPLCERNLYTLSPDGSCSLVSILSEFSPPISLGEFTDGSQYTVKQQNERVQIIIWMLRHGLLHHLHTYIYLCAPRHSN